jgi:hypothetical protein
MPELTFVLGSAASAPLADLAATLAAEVSGQDAVASVVTGFPESRPDRIVVVFDADLATDRAVGGEELRRTIIVVTEEPGSPGFGETADLARRVGMAFHVNSIALDGLHAAGVPARHLQLGFSSSWPTRDASADGLAVIRGGGYFAWPEALAAIHRNDVVLHEQCLGATPLVAGRHLFVAVPESLELVGDLLRRRQARLAAVRKEAKRFVGEALPMALAASALIGAARAAVAQPMVGPASSLAQPAARSI